MIVPIAIFLIIHEFIISNYKSGVDIVKGQLQPGKNQQKSIIKQQTKKLLQQRSTVLSKLLFAQVFFISNLNNLFFIQVLIFYILCLRQYYRHLVWYYSLQPKTLLDILRLNSLKRLTLVRSIVEEETWMPWLVSLMSRWEEHPLKKR